MIYKNTIIEKYNIYELFWKTIKNELDVVRCSLCEIC